MISTRGMFSSTFHNIFSVRKWENPGRRKTTRPSNMADGANTNMEVDQGDKMPSPNKVDRLAGEISPTLRKDGTATAKEDADERRGVTTEYCEKLQAWMWQYYTGYVNWQSWLALSAMSSPYLQSTLGGGMAPVDLSSSSSQNWYSSTFGLPVSPHPPAGASPGGRTGEAAGGAAVAAPPPPQQPDNRNAQRQGKKLHLSLNL